MYPLTIKPQAWFHAVNQQLGQLTASDVLRMRQREQLHQ
jgi:hypothetical protein